MAPFFFMTNIDKLNPACCTQAPCCQSGCEDCPYDYKNKVDPNIPAELLLADAIADSNDYE
jgi:hypothetical protein